MRSSGQFEVCFLKFFYEKNLNAQKHITSKNQLTKQKQTVNNKGNNFSRAQKLLRGWKSFVYVWVLFLRLKFFVKRNKQTWNCPDNLIYYTTAMGLFITKQIHSFLCFQNIMTCLSHSTVKHLFKVKSRNTILISWLWSKSTIKTPELCYAVFIFNFKHIQQINLIFLLLTLNMYLSVGHRMKSAKQLKCALNIKTVSLKHVHVTWVNQHGWHNP